MKQISPGEDYELLIKCYRNQGDLVSAAGVEMERTASDVDLVSLET